MPENSQIQQLLAALPEMFPGVQKIPLPNIRLNPNNPGAKAAEEDIAELAANIALVGLKNAAKVMPDPAGPLAPGLTPHPDNFRVKADNTPWSLSDFRFLNLSGELRQLACQRLQWTVMDGIILNPTPEEAVEITDLDNDVRQKGWWAKYQSVENLIKANPTLKQREIATRLKTNVKRVNWAISLLPLLNTEARGVLVSNGNKSNKGKDAISEISASHLADLGPESILKPGGTPNDPAQTLYPYPAIPPETQDLVYRTLVVACKHQMKEAQVQKLVEWVLAGNPPETYAKAPSPKKASGNQTPQAKPAPGIPPEALEKAIDLAEQVGLAKGRGEDPQPAQDKLKAFRESLSVPGQSQSSVKEPSYPIFHPKGFALLCWKIAEEAKAVFKTDPETEPVIEKEVQANGGSSAQPHPAPKMKWFKKLGKKLVELPWKELGKIEHQIARKLAHAIVPLRSSNRGHHNSGLGQQFATLFLTILHCMVYCLLQFGFWWFVLTGLASWVVPGLKPWVAWPFRFAAHLVIYDFPAWAWANFQSHLGPTLLIGAVLLIGLYYTCKAEPLRMSLLGIALAYLMVQARGWAVPSAPWSEPVASATPSVSVPTAVPQPVRSSELEVRSSSLKTPNSKLRTANSTPAASYQPAVSFAPPAAPEQTLYDAKLLEQEIAALPKNCVVKAFPVLTDEGMPGDLAVSRSQGVTDPDKYTLIIDGDKKVIVNIATTTTNLIINYKSADPLNLDGAGQLNHFWEDVLYIHTDEIEVEGTTPYQFYQCSLVVSGAKHAMTIQCASADDLKHLVSALQYFIRNSRLSPSLGGLGHDTALAGMPYPYQGLVLNNDGVVDKLWADSLMDKAAVSLGDHFWSIGKVAFQRQSRSDLEAGLKTLPVTVFVASASEWDRAMKARTNVANSFRPRLRKITLEVGK